MTVVWPVDITSIVTACALAGGIIILMGTTVSLGFYLVGRLLYGAKHISPLPHERLRRIRGGTSQTGGGGGGTTPIGPGIPGGP